MSLRCATRRPTTTLSKSFPVSLRRQIACTTKDINQVFSASSIESISRFSILKRSRRRSTASTDPKTAHTSPLSRDPTIPSELGAFPSFYLCTGASYLLLGHSHRVVPNGQHSREQLNCSLGIKPSPATLEGNITEVKFLQHHPIWRAPGILLERNHF